MNLSLAFVWCWISKLGLAAEYFKCTSFVFLEINCITLNGIYKSVLLFFPLPYLLVCLPACLPACLSECLSECLNVSLSHKCLFKVDCLKIVKILMCFTCGHFDKLTCGHFVVFYLWTFWQVNFWTIWCVLRYFLHVLLVEILTCFICGHFEIFYFGTFWHALLVEILT